MKKYLCLKAFILLIVIFFHSFVLVPRAIASSYEGVVAKAFYEAVAPSVVAATPAGRGYLLALAVGSAVVYIAIKSGAVTAVKNWFNGINADSGKKSFVGPIGTWGPGFTVGGQVFKIKLSADGVHYDLQQNGNGAAGNATWQQIIDQIAYWGSWNPAPLAAPTVPTNYGTQLAASQPSLNTNDVFMSQGAAAMLAAGTAALVKATEMADAELEALKLVMGLTSPDHTTGVQPKPNLGDNTVSADANQSIPLLSQIVNFVSNLVGIKSDTSAIRTNMDCVVSVVSGVGTNVQSMSTKLDNIAVLTQAQNNILENVVIAINNQTSIDNAMLGKIDNVAQSIGSLNNVAATQSTISTRIDGLKSLMATKFPFSFISGITAPSGGGGGHYDIPDLQFTGGYVLVVDPMKYPVFANFFGTVRTLVAIGMWAVFTLVMIRRVTQI